jgi:hypothetical protein
MCNDIALRRVFFRVNSSYFTDLTASIVSENGTTVFTEQCIRIFHPYFVEFILGSVQKKKTRQSCGCQTVNIHRQLLDQIFNRTILTDRDNTLIPC